MGSLTFHITPFLLWKFWNHRTFHVNSFREKGNVILFVSVVCFQPMEWFALVCPVNVQVVLLSDTCTYP
jgi:hypothetical protein